jgi:hypothetical protein
VTWRSASQRASTQKIELYREPPTNGAKGIKTLYTSIDLTPLKDIFDLVGRGQYHYVGSVCKEWNAVYWQGDDHDWKMELFWHNQQSSQACIELWLEDIDKNKLRKLGYNQKLGDYHKLYKPNERDHTKVAIKECTNGMLVGKGKLMLPT